MVFLANSLPKLFDESSSAMIHREVIDLRYLSLPSASKICR